MIVLDFLTTVLAMVLLAAVLLSYLEFVAFLGAWAVKAVVFRLEREVGGASMEITLAFLYAPLLSAGAAIYAGVGVNVITGDDDPAWYGYLVMLVSIVVLVLGGRGLVKIAAGRAKGLFRVRYRLQSITGAEPSAAEHARALVYARRVGRVGERLLRRAEGMTFRVWCRHHRKTAWILALPGLVCTAYLMLVATVVWVAPPMPNEVWMLSVAGSAAVAGLATPVLEWLDKRQTIRAFGAEFRDAGAKAEAHLLRNPPAVTWVERLRRPWAWILLRDRGDSAQ